MGDRVLVIFDTSAYYGEIGTIRRHRGGFTEVLYLDGARCDYPTERLDELLSRNSMQKFRVGDKVKFINTESVNYGKVGVVSSVAKAYISVKVKTLEFDYPHSTVKSLFVLTKESMMKRFYNAIHSQTR